MRMTISLAIVWAALLFFHTEIKSNTAEYHQFTTEDGLPSNTVYRCDQDAMGNIWFATESGLAKYDGYSFKSFGQEFGLPKESCFGVHVDLENRVWVDILGHIGYVKDDYFYEVYLSEGNHDRISHVLTAPNGKTLFKNRMSAIFFTATMVGDTIYPKDTISHKGNVNGLEEFFIEFNIRSFYDGVSIHALQDSIVQMIVPIDFKKREYDWSSGLLVGRYEHYVFGNGFAGSIENEMYQPFSSLLKSDQVYLDMIELGPDKIALSSKTGLSIVSRTDASYLETMFEAAEICDLHIDHQGLLWLTTLDQGVIVSSKFMMLQNKVSNYSRDPIYADSNESVYADGNSLVTVSKLGTTDIEFNSYIVDYNQGHLITNGALYVDTSKSRNILKIRDSSWKNSLKRIEFTSPKDMIAQENHVWTVGAGGVVLVALEDETRVLKNLGYRVYSGCSFSDESILICNSDGLAIVHSDLTSQYLTFKQEPVFPAKVDQMVMIGGRLYVVTETGLGFSLRFRGNKRIGDITQLKLPKLERLHYSNEKFLGTIDDKMWTWTVTKGDQVRNFREYNFSSNNVKGALYDSYGNIEIGTQDGLIYASRNDGKRMNFPHQLLVTVSANNSDFLQSSVCKVSPGPNQIRLNFKTILFDAKNRVEYHFRISTDDQPGEWNVTKQTSQDYFNLSPGKYKFEVKSVVDGYLESRHTEFIYIIVKPQLWQTLAFQIGALLLVLLLVSGAFYLRLRAIRNREDERREVLNQLNNLKMQALQSQMNPHFIFNSLTSIQISIDNGDVEPVKDYLTKFARLLRRILESSRSGKIVLREEIELLEWYIKLETSRFNGRITYEIIAENVDVDLLEIPPMIIQPYVENAIHHGLEPKQGVGHLVIGFNEENENLICSIEDNGVGREGAIANKSRNQYKRKSLSSEINEERLQLSYEGRSGQVKTFDLMDVENNTVGTRVVIKLPGL